MSFGVKTNERPGTRAVVRNVRMSAKKARVVLDLIRGLPTDDAHDLLQFTERRAAEVVGGCLDSAIANAEHNDELDPEGLYVAACFADEGKTLYRFRPRARGRATRIRKRTCHITIIVSPMPPEMLERHQAKQEAIPGSRASRRRGQQEAERRAKRVAASQEQDHDHDHDEDDTAGNAAEAPAPDAEEAESTASDAAEAPAGAASETDAVAEGEAEDSDEGADEASSVTDSDEGAESTAGDAAEAPAGAASDAGAIAEGQAGEATKEPSGRNKTESDDEVNENEESGDAGDADKGSV